METILTYFGIVPIKFSRAILILINARECLVVPGMRFFAFPDVCQIASRNNRAEQSAMEKARVLSKENIFQSKTVNASVWLTEILPQIKKGRGPSNFKFDLQPL